MSNTMTREQFEETYGVVTTDDGEAYVNHEKTLEYDPHYVWTIVDADMSGDLYALPGYHVVNKLYYIITEKPWEGYDVEAEWSIEEDREVERDPNSPDMTYYCPTCDDVYPVSNLSIVQDASVTFRFAYDGTRWHTNPMEPDDVNLYDQIDIYCGECNNEIPDDFPHEMYIWDDYALDRYREMMTTFTANMPFGKVD